MKKTLLCLMMLYASAGLAYDGLGRPFTGQTTANVVSAGQGYVVWETAENDVAVKFYVDAKNTIFAVSWSGVTLPDLGSLLGQYAHYRDNQVAQPARDLRHHRVTDNDLVIAKNYAGRAKRGYAYLKTLLPQNFDIDTLAP
jgi:hypothetical protein